MGKNLHYSILKFFKERMQLHNGVFSIKDLNIEGDYVFEVHRRKFDDKVNVWLSDQYHFGEGDFLNRPKEIRRGDYILIARPEAMSHPGSDLHAKIGIGKIGDLMGALNKKEMWKYEPPSEEERMERRRTRS